MKTFKLLALAGAFASITSYQSLQGKNTIKNSKLENIETLSIIEDEPVENKYDYTIWENDPCYILVGGAFAKGAKVSCYSGTKYPQCVDCKL